MENCDERRTESTASSFLDGCIPGQEALGPVAKKNTIDAMHRSQKLYSHPCQPNTEAMAFTDLIHTHLDLVPI